MKGLNGGLLFLILVIIVAFAFIGISSAIENLNGFGANVTANGTQGFIPRFMNETFLNNSVIFQKDNNIGIGSFDPQVKLEVVGQVQGTSLRANSWAEISSLFPVAFDPEEPLSLTGYTWIKSNQSLILSKEDIGGGLAFTHMLDVRGNGNFSGNISAFNIFTDAVKSCSTELETDSEGRIFCGTSTGGGGGNPFNQSLNTSDSVLLRSLNLTGDLRFSSLITHFINMPNQTTIETPGIDLRIVGGKGGDSESIGGQNGGNVFISAGEGGQDGTGSTSAGGGGVLNLSGGTGGNATLAGSTSNRGGVVDIHSGDNGQTQSGNIAAADILIYTGRPQGTGSQGRIFLGYTRGAVFSQNVNISQWLNVSRINVTQTANFFRNISVSNVQPNGARNISGITMYNESARPWCVRVTGQGTLQAIQGTCGG